MKFILFIIPILFTFYVKGQNNQLDINAEWHVNTYAKNIGNGCYFKRDFNEYFSGDTVINGNQYFKLNDKGYHYNLPGSQPLNCPTNSYFFNYNTGTLVRYNQKKLYTYSIIDNQESVFLDYNLVVGDTIKNVGFSSPYGATLKLLITNIDSILINGIYVKRFYYPNPGSATIKYVIEKFGSVQGFLNPYSYDFESGSELVCYSESNIILYNEPSSTINCELALNINERSNDDINIVISPNPSSHNFLIHLKDDNHIIKTMTIINCIGETILVEEQPKANVNYDISSLKKGIYFIALDTETGVIVKKMIKE